MGIWTDDPRGPDVDVIPQRSGLTLGDPNHYWDTIFVDHIVTPGGAGSLVGEATLVNGTVTVSFPTINGVTMEIFVNHKQFFGTPGVLSPGTIIDGVSFDITSTSSTDNSIVKYLIITTA